MKPVKNKRKKEKYRNEIRWFRLRWANTSKWKWKWKFSLSSWYPMICGNCIILGCPGTTSIVRDPRSCTVVLPVKTPFEKFSQFRFNDFLDLHAEPRSKQGKARKVDFFTPQLWVKFVLDLQYKSQHGLPTYIKPQANDNHKPAHTGRWFV